MGDVAHILGLKPVSDKNTEDVLKGIVESKKTVKVKTKTAKVTGIARELLNLVGQDSILPAAQPSAPAPAFKSKRANVSRGKWVWAPFSNSGRR